MGEVKFGKLHKDYTVLVQLKSSSAGNAYCQIGRTEAAPKGGPHTAGAGLQYLSKGNTAGPGDSPALGRCQERTSHFSGPPELQQGSWAIEEGQVRVLRAIQAC